MNWKSPSLILILILGLGIQWWHHQRSQNVTTSVVNAPATKRKEPPPQPLYFDLKKLSESAVDQSKLADQLNQPEVSPQQDLSILKTIFRQYRTAYRENPTGNHDQILERLLGNNPNGIAFIPPNHPAIRGGMLHDRWGTPFYFHQISETTVEIRSAGPDGRHWNSDDIVLR